MRRRRVRRLIALVTAAVLGAAAQGCSRSVELKGEGRLEPAGQVILTRHDHPATVTSSRGLVTGDVVEVSEGTAKVMLPGGDQLELRPHSVLVVDRGPELRSGSLLVTAAGMARTLRAIGSTVDLSGAARVDVALALRVGVYAGQAVLRSGGRTVAVPPLRSASVPVLGVLRGPQPLAVDPDDAWDQRFLGEAATRTADLESLANGFTGLVAPANASSVPFYRGILPGLAGEAGFQQPDVDRLGRAAADSTEGSGRERYRAGDVLFGTAIALLGRRGTFAQRMGGAAEFRVEGASWALVSRDQQVESIDGLQRLVKAAIDAAKLEVAAPGAAPTTVAPVVTPTRTAPTTVPTTPRPGPSPSTTTPGRTTPTTTPGPARPQPPATPPTLVLPVDPLVDAVVDPVAKLLNDLLGTKRP